MADKRMSRREVERALHGQGILLVVTLSAVVLLFGALFRKGVLKPGDLVADG